MRITPAHPNLSPEIQNAITQSEIDGGKVPSTLAIGRGYYVQTRNTLYTLRKLVGGTWTIQGHPRYCPTATPCNIHGSTWGGSMIKVDFIGRGMQLEVGLIMADQLEPRVMTTSSIASVEEIA